MTVKYSIVIPTRNRAEYLKYAIKSVLDSTRNDIELIVSNNFSSDATLEILSKINDSRLRVISPNISLPMTDHFEFALSHAKGDWVTILGDDDAVMPYIFESLDKYINQYPQIDIISSVRAYYFWEGCEDLYGNAVVNYLSKQKIQIRSTKKDLFDVLKGFRSCFDMPQIYTTSIIKRDLYEEIKEISGGCFYHSIIPDMYSVVALSLYRDKYLRVDEPLFWVGTSNKSMGRSDRIYRDADQCNNYSADLDKRSTKSISSDISYILHSSGFSSIYIYECLLRSPLKNEVHRHNKIRVFVLAAVLNDVKRRNKTEKNQLVLEIWAECSRYGLSKTLVFVYAFVFNILSIIQRFLLIPGKILQRIGLHQNYFLFQSMDRNEFPNILDASVAIKNILAKK
jgi:glycosyltransferase involved in cell wall biosynthesis